MRIYVAGPMTGLPDHNFPAFFEVAERLEAIGHTPINPADHDGATLEEAIANQHSLGDWTAYMKRDIPRLVACDAVYLMDGWKSSKGATLEHFIAEELGMPFFSSREMPPEVRPVVVGLTGYARSGKDSFAETLIAEYGFERIAFADALKLFVRMISPRINDLVIDDGRGWEGAKQDERIRRLLQNVGLAAREVLGEDVWVQAALRDLRRDGRYVVTDVRFPNELEAIHALGGEVLRLLRPLVGPANDHVSESALEDAPIDRAIQNDRGLDELAASARFYAEVHLGLHYSHSEGDA